MFLQTSALAAGAALAPKTPAQSAKQYNVLFIAVDDLRPQLGCYGFSQMKTPHIDRLASQGLLFERAYCQQAVCSPSRTSLLTGLRPDSTKVYDLQTHFRLTIPDVVTLPQYFKIHGYHTQALSKIYHGGLDDPASWSVPHWSPKAKNYGSQEILEAMKHDQEELLEKNEGPAVEILERDSQTGQPLKVTRPKFRVRGPSWESPDVSDNALPDGETADRAVELLRALKNQRFFLAVGFLKPHLPFVAPRKYFDSYPPESISAAENSYPPKDAPPFALHNFGELRNYKDIPKEGPLPEEKSKELVRAYYAAASYVDAQIGRVLDELDKLDLRKNTVVVLWGDHGWQLGEHALWCKHTNFETSTHSPLILSAPDMPAQGIKTDRLAEFVDIYPTLCELCSLPVPGGLEGVSLAPLMKDPHRPWKKAAFSQYPRGNNIMGYSMRTDRYRYTEWIRKDVDEPAGVELYDHALDPQENVNIAGRPEEKERILQLGKMLHASWRNSLPPGYSKK
ncbi:MAG: sulfatase [Candidatus Omnitrophica bacterium]|nr:sulfatase [Candidatus Omnitrophota bacterium]